MGKLCTDDDIVNAVLVAITNQSLKDIIDFCIKNEVYYESNLALLLSDSNTKVIETDEEDHHGLHILHIYITNSVIRLYDAEAFESVRLDFYSDYKKRLLWRLGAKAEMDIDYLNIKKIFYLGDQTYIHLKQPTTPELTERIRNWDIIK